MERFKEYSTRKKDLFELIKEQGNVDYEYNFNNKQKILNLLFISGDDYQMELDQVEVEVDKEE